MEFNRKESFLSSEMLQQTDIKDIFEKYLRHWKWFLLFALVFVGSSYFYVRKIVPEYNVNASILIKEKEKGNSFSELSQFEDLGLFSSGDNSLENEVQILKSRRLMTKVVKELKLNVSYFIEDSPYDKEHYPNFPLVLNFDPDTIVQNDYYASYKIVVNSKDKFEFFNSEDESLGIKKFDQPFKVHNVSNGSVESTTIVINKNKAFSRQIIGETILVSLYPVNLTVDIYMNKLVIDLINDKVSNVLTIGLTESNRNKGIALINNLIEQYNADGINDKNSMAQTTTDFLDLRLGLISTELESIENTAEQFKSKNRMVDNETGANIYLQSSSSTESEIVAINTQIQLANYMFDELNKQNFGELLPGNIGLSEPGIINLISEYNEVVLQRKRILKSSSEINPIIVNLDSQLDVLKNNLRSSLGNLKSTLEIRALALNKQSGRISSRIAAVPKNEKEFKDIVRQQETKNALYLFLLQKREESILANAVNVDKAKIIDVAFSNGRPVSPKKKAMYFAALLIGLIIPALYIYLKDQLDTKIHDEKDISILSLPYLGDIPFSTNKKDLFVSDGDDSNIAEAFRYIRTNIHFMLDRSDKCKTIFVTSTLSHEGKTFTAINLASSLAISGKKTLLLAMDLRAPKIGKYLNLKNNKGVTNFITDPELTFYEIIDRKTGIQGLDIIHSGDIPPNPVELLMSKRVDELFESIIADYDYIIVDSAPVGMVTDTIQISKYSDLSIYVMRANFLDKRMLHIPNKMNKEGKLPNMAAIINGTEHSRGNYGYGYGYGQVKKKGFFEKLKSAVI